jgi:hypothetical protein
MLGERNKNMKGELTEALKLMIFLFQHNELFLYLKNIIENNQKNRE